jgi:hypothetical protein
MLLKTVKGIFFQPNGGSCANITVESKVLSQYEKGKPVVRQGRKTVSLKLLARSSGYRKRYIFRLPSPSRVSRDLAFAANWRWTDSREPDAAAMVVRYSSAWFGVDNSPLELEHAPKLYCDEAC